MKPSNFKKDYYGGALMMVIGLTAAYVGYGYRIGTPSRMGPGFFPLAVGLLLAFTGVLIALSARGDSVSSGGSPGHGHGMPDVRGALCIIASVLAFLLLGVYGGLVPATFAIVFISALGDRGNTVFQAFMLSMAMCLIAGDRVLVGAATAAAAVPVGGLRHVAVPSRPLVRLRRRVPGHQPDVVVLRRLVGNLIGVLPGMGALSAISILLPLTYAMHPVPAILMLAGIFYGSQYGGAIGAILLNLPSHPPHAVTCLDGYPMTRAGKGGTALGITMISSFFAASVGILVMIFASPLLVSVAFKFGPTEIFSIMLLGLLAGSTMSRGSPLKGVAMTLFGLLCGMVGTDVNSGSFRFSFDVPELSDGLELVAISMGLFGVADFLLNVNRMAVISSNVQLRIRDMRPSLAELKEAFWPMVRGTAVGTVFGAMPGTGPTNHHLHRLCAGAQGVEDAGEIRHRHDRRRGCARSLVALEDAGRLHPHDEPGDPGRRSDGAQSSAH